MKKEKTFKQILPSHIKEYRITYLDEAQIRKLLYGLKEINKLAYKQVVLRNIDFEKENGKHELILNTDKSFKKLYGDVRIIYSTYDNNIVIENIEPSRVLIEYHNKKKNTYRGMPFVDNKDIFKINLIREMEK